MTITIGAGNSILCDGAPTGICVTEGGHGTRVHDFLSELYLPLPQLRYDLDGFDPRAPSRAVFDGDVTEMLDHLDERVLAMLMDEGLGPPERGRALLCRINRRSPDEAEPLLGEMGQRGWQLVIDHAIAQTFRLVPPDSRKAARALYARLDPKRPVVAAARECAGFSELRMVAYLDAGRTDLLLEEIEKAGHSAPSMLCSANLAEPDAIRLAGLALQTIVDKQDLVMKLATKLLWDAKSGAKPPELLVDMVQSFSADEREWLRAGLSQLLASAQHGHASQMTGAPALVQSIEAQQAMTRKSIPERIEMSP